MYRPKGSCCGTVPMSCQINLDLGPEGAWRERWLAANLISPLITASFACSPGDGWASSRGAAWP